MKKDSNIIVRVDSNLKESAFRLAKANGYKLSDIVLAFLKSICKKGRIPLNLNMYLPHKDLSQSPSIAEIKKAVDVIIAREGKDLVNKVYLYGSFARNEERTDSDIDLRIESEYGLGLIDLGNIRLELKDALKREIDLISGCKEELDPSFYESIKKDEICVYEK